MVQEIIRQIDEYVFAHQYDEALELMDALINKLQGENLAYMYYYKAGVLAFKGCTEDALIAINKACYLSPSNIKYINLKGNINSLLGNNETAMESQIKVLEKLPGAIQYREEEFENSVNYMKEIKQNFDNGEFKSKEELLDFFAEQIKPNSLEEGFAYEDFSENLVNQVKNVLPNDISSDKGEYVYNSVKSLTLWAGNRLKYKTGDILNRLVLDDKYWVMQIIAEWVFHKSIDVQRADLPTEACDTILYTIAMGVCEALKKALEQDLEEQDILNSVESNVKNIYKKILETLLNSKTITKENYDKAIIQSNIDLM